MEGCRHVDGHRHMVAQPAHEVPIYRRFCRSVGRLRRRKHANIRVSLRRLRALPGCLAETRRRAPQGLPCMQCIRLAAVGVRPELQAQGQGLVRDGLQVRQGDPAQPRGWPRGFSGSEGSRRPGQGPRRLREGRRPVPRIRLQGRPARVPVRSRSPAQAANPRAPRPDRATAFSGR